MKYFTITRDTTVERIVWEIEFAFGKGALCSYEPPVNLYGNARILTLRGRTGLQIKAKVDGPGFLIDELYEKFR